MDQVITFDKSLQKRLQEYSEMFADQVMTVSEITREWRNCLEFSLDPNGWQAVWKIPRSVCEQMQVSFPIVVLVYVDSINFSELTAAIKIIAVQDDVSLQEMHCVPLTQLWPTKCQDKTVVLNINATANALDMYRFFYTNVFFPWDHDEIDNYDWLSDHLESRLRLFYDVKNGIIPCSTAEHIKTLLTNARRLQTLREQLEVRLIENEVDEENIADERVQVLMELNVGMIEIKNEIELLENPLTRKVIIKRKIEVSQKNVLKQFWIIYYEGSVDDYFGFLERLKVYHPNEKFKFATDLTHVLEIMTPQDTIILNKSLHFINTSGGLQNGGNLKGIYNKDSTTITSTNNNVMLDFNADVLLENITISASYAQCGILVRAGRTTLKNCRLISNETSSTQQGVIVLKGGTLVLEGCELSGFCTAIVGNSGAKIAMSNTEIFDANYAIKMHDHCEFKATKCTLRDCKKYSLCLETNKKINGYKQVGSYEILEIIPEVTIKDVNGKNNMKGNVLINQKPKLTPSEDLFSNPESDPTKVQSSHSEEEEMDVNDLNVTVIEKHSCPEAGDKI